MNARPLVGVVSPMGQAQREYLLRSLAGEFDVWAFDDQRRNWVDRHVVGQSTVDPYDEEQLTRAAGAAGVDALISWDELSAYATARAARTLGLPGPAPEAVRVCRDKYLTRRALSEYGMSMPASVPVSDIDQALAAASRTGYPAVLKPRALAGSVGPMLVRSPGELVRVFPDVLGARLPGVRVDLAEPLVLETYLDGPEISVDSVCFDGVVHPLFVARKELGSPPFFEETGHWVEAGDALLHDEQLLSRLRDVHAGVGFDQGWTHTEWRLTRNGPELVEINSRLGGDLIPQLGGLATGLRPAVIVAEVALGRRPDLTARGLGAAAVRFVYPDLPGELEALVVDGERLPREVVRLDPLAEPGQWLLPSAQVGGRAALVVCAGDGIPEVAKAIDESLSAITLVLRKPGGEPCHLTPMSGRLPVGATSTAPTATSTTSATSPGDNSLG
ncbi:ATP-grasp domain-containing protein [Micromonospora sp. NPDC048170]|uniref:ATP-grasp domain-containing protein n=1 Tax=Micromonospora sp. NPDC048170 TaxID=3154819 RepID=UPI0033F435B6